MRGVRTASEPNIIGVESAIWTEWIDTENKLFFNMLPRLAATAETGWTARRGEYKTFLTRLKPHYMLYDRLKLTYAKNVEQPLSLLKRIQGVVTYAKDETHAELFAQQKQEKI